MLSIAGSDSGGGAGIQADLKAFASCGVHGMTAITALTAQNTIAVDAVAAVAPEMIVAQVRAVARDIGVDAVKIGMLGTVATIDAVVAALDELPAATPIVLDPVMVSESGSQLLEDDAREALVTRLLPRVTVTTPNVPEARVIAEGAAGAGTATGAGAGETARADAPELARAIHALGPRVVVVTGGHREQATDVRLRRADAGRDPRRAVPDGAAHGSGCTHSSALAAHLALGYRPGRARRGRRRRSRRGRCAMGCARSAEARDRSTRSASAGGNRCRTALGSRGRRRGGARRCGRAAGA